MKYHLIFFVSLFLFLPFSRAQNYSIKNRWNTKLSLSFNRTNEPNNGYFMEIDGVPLHPIQARLNARAECNYGVLNWLELGSYLGYIRYKHAFLDFTKPMITRFAPTFGINANVHLLPFWVKNKNSGWELYLTAEYGGTYLIHHVGGGFSGYTFDSNGNITLISGQCLPYRYRQIFGAGVGGGVYFGKKKQIVGLYTEAKVGQYSYFPELCKVYWTARLGIEFKFYAKKKKTESKEDDGILFH